MAILCVHPLAQAETFSFRLGICSITWREIKRHISIWDSRSTRLITSLSCSMLEDEKCLVASSPACVVGAWGARANPPREPSGTGLHRLPTWVGENPAGRCKPWWGDLPDTCGEEPMWTGLSWGPPFAYLPPSVPAHLGPGCCCCHTGSAACQRRSSPCGHVAQGPDSAWSRLENEPSLGSGEPAALQIMDGRRHFVLFLF